MANTSKENSTDIGTLEKEPSFLAAIVQFSDDAILGMTLEGVIKSWNRGAEKMFGYSEDEAVGKPVSMLYPPERLGEHTDIFFKSFEQCFFDWFRGEKIKVNRFSVSNLQSQSRFPSQIKVLQERTLVPDCSRVIV